MNVLINLISIKAGGGQQVATNFIRYTIEKICEHHEIYFVVTENTKVDQLIKEYGYQSVFRIKNNIYDRFLFEKYQVNKIIKRKRIDIIYTLFGVGIKAKNVCSIVGSAYSNIFFPEVHFWKEDKFFKKVFLKFRDYIRLKSSLKCDAIVFENPAMQKRAIDLFNYPENRTIFIPASVSNYNSNNIDRNTDFKHKLSLLPKGKYGLFLTGYHKNKNLEKMPEIISLLQNKYHMNDFYFLVTINEDDPQIKHIIHKAENLNVLEKIIFFGKIDPLDVPQIFKKIDVVLLLSLLESFSNNIIESWYFNKPLIISDEKWSRGICGNSAFFINRERVDSISDTIYNVLSNENERKKIIKNGHTLLKNYPTPLEKVERQYEFLEKMYKVFVN